MALAQTGAQIVCQIFAAACVRQVCAEVASCHAFSAFKMLFIKNNEIILSAPTSEAYTRVDFLKKNRFKIPSIIQITYLAKKSKGTKIIYHKDVRDLIKDIYKHV